MSSTRIKYVKTRWWVGLGIGSVVAVVGLLGLRYPYSEWLATVSRREVAGHRLASLWLVLFGIGILLAAFASRWNPLIAAVPAIVWIGIYGPFMIGLMFPDWTPRWVNDWVLTSYGAHVPIVIGALSGAALWNGWIAVREHQGRRNSG